MTTNKQAFLGGTVQSSPVVSCGVIVVFHRQFGQLLSIPVAGPLPRVGPSDALSAVFVGG
jgi:hypothetical protein